MTFGTDPATQASDDRRERPRSTTALTARLFPGGVACEIVDVSTRGMCLRFDAPTPMPDLFVVVEWATGDAHEGEMVWAVGAEVGVRILRSGDLKGRVPSAFTEARDSWIHAMRPERGVGPIDQSA